MNRIDNKVEMDIISEMESHFPCLHEPERMFISKIFKETPPEKRLEIEKIMDALIMVVHERNRLERLKKRDQYEIELLAFANGEINALCYVLGYDTRL